MRLTKDRGEFMERVEEFCQCDISSNETAGAYIKNVWHCDRCLSEIGDGRRVSEEYASNEFRKMRESLDESESVDNTSYN